MNQQEMQEPISTKAWKRKMSPSTKPTKPEIKSQNQASGAASVGRAKPLVNQAVSVRRGRL